MTYRPAQSTSDQEISVQAQAGLIVLCSCGRHITSTKPLISQGHNRDWGIVNNLLICWCGVGEGRGESGVTSIGPCSPSLLVFVVLRSKTRN